MTTYYGAGSKNGVRVLPSSKIRKMSSQPVLTIFRGESLGIPTDVDKVQLSTNNRNRRGAFPTIPIPGPTKAVNIAIRVTQYVLSAINNHGIAPSGGSSLGSYIVSCQWNLREHDLSCPRVPLHKHGGNRTTVHLSAQIWFSLVIPILLLRPFNKFTFYGELQAASKKSCCSHLQQ